MEARVSHARCCAPRPLKLIERVSMDLKNSGSRLLSIAIVDDHPLVREGLAARISAQPDMEVCGEADDIESAMELIVARRPALVIVDIALRDGHGIDLIKRIVAAGRTN